MPVIDWSLDVGNLIVMAGGVISFVWGAITVRDSLRDMRAAIGSTDHPRSGILGKQAMHDESIDNLERMARRHRDWLIEMNAKADDPIRMERT